LECLVRIEIDTSAEDSLSHTHSFVRAVSPSLRRLQARNNMLEGLHLDQMSMGVEVDDGLASAVMGEAVEMPDFMGGQQYSSGSAL